MRICAGCSNEYNEDFKFCPECGRPFGGQEAANRKRELDQHLMGLKAQASREASISRRVFAGGLGDSIVGPIYRGNGESPDMQ